MPAVCLPAYGGDGGGTLSDIRVFTTTVEPMADMAVDLLRGEGIPARKSIAYRELSFWIGDDGGMLDVIVPERFAEAAVELLNARFSESGEISDDGRE